MKLPEEINVTEQMIDISKLSEAQEVYYHELAEELRAKYEELGRGRQVFTLSGPPGSGKSVISAILNFIYLQEAPFIFLNVGLDAFHYPNNKLAALDLMDVKGRFDTYNLELLIVKIEQFIAGQKVAFPYYSREEHNPIPDSLAVSDKNVLLLLEGQWLLLDRQDWTKVREFSSYNLYVEGNAKDMRENVIRRHIAGGRSPEKATTFFAENDAKNTKSVQEESVGPDKKVLFYKDI